MRLCQRGLIDAGHHKHGPLGATFNQMNKTILVLIFLSWTTNELTACSCEGRSKVRDEIKNSDVLFVGAILDQENRIIEGPPIMRASIADGKKKMLPTSHQTIRYRLLIESVYKGKISRDTITIISGEGGGDCGIVFEVGEKYIVYGRKRSFFGRPIEKNAYWTDICTRTTRYDKSEVDDIEKFVTKKKRKKVK